MDEEIQGEVGNEVESGVGNEVEKQVALWNEGMWISFLLGIVFLNPLVYCSPNLSSYQNDSKIE
jgi:hypothetical protein